LKGKTQVGYEVDKVIGGFEGRLLEGQSSLLVGDLQTALRPGDENDAARVAQPEHPVSLASGPNASYRTPL
jgi:hypothetical protein